MAIPNILQIGYSGMSAAKAAIATTGHNISNANTEGYTRQRVVTETNVLSDGISSTTDQKIGTGTKIARIERVNDEYIEKQIRNSGKDLSHAEEKDLVLRQLEDIFNEMNGDGINRLISRFYNEFKKLANEPESPSIRESVREASQALVNDFHRISTEVNEVRNHIDSRIDGYVREVNSIVQEIKGLDQKIQDLDSHGGASNDLLDKRDLALRKLGTYLEVSSYQDTRGKFCVDIKGLGPLISSGGDPETLSVERTSANDEGKADGSLDVKSTGNAQKFITHLIRGGKLGALIETRDQMLSNVLSQMDEIAYHLAESVNEIHRQGFTQNGESGVSFFTDLDQVEGAAQAIGLSDEIKSDIGQIAAAVEENAPGDNRIALAISKLQDAKTMNDGTATPDEWYNSIVSEIAVATSQNKFVMNQQKDIIAQLNKIRDQISGVSIDEETANLLQYQHVYDASAKVIQLADEMLKTIMSLVRT